MMPGSVSAEAAAAAMNLRREEMFVSELMVMSRMLGHHAPPVFACQLSFLDYRLNHTRRSVRTRQKAFVSDASQGVFRQSVGVRGDGSVTDR